ncbi:unnamed protein product [Lepeophtheirus salmonis]|uniref:(salmon louse) hypothetical protein n=1 Tax=Lepeophtheirus salmonis TaxID=72036 RepID=A0A7R8H9T1_LEPSM|nr:unnamed protein product [Lepeophtheirus salmonis]CAF2966018.1 unnamed protein product [Lepeophtheirus salmonis]
MYSFSCIVKYPEEKDSGVVEMETHSPGSLRDVPNTNSADENPKSSMSTDRMSRSMRGRDTGYVGSKAVVEGNEMSVEGNNTSADGSKMSVGGHRDGGRGQLTSSEGSERRVVGF